MKKKESYFKVKDYSVSGEEFELVPNKNYGFLETVPQPKEENLSDYYKTEDYISHTDSKRNLFEKAYHLVRSISLKRKLKIINSFSDTANNSDSCEKKSLLDFGCGTGDFLQTAQQNNWKVLGIEPNQQAREIANRKTTNAVFNSEHLNKIENQSFDVITLWHVLEHVPNLEEQISVFKKLLKENGVLIVAVPNYKSFDAKHYKNFWAAYDVPRHLWHFNQDSLASLFSKENMKVVNTLPMKFDSYYVSLLSEKYQNGFMNPFKAFWAGFRSNWLAKRSGEYSSLIYILKNG
ncbi:class I SAM-dependent methyltransferase [Oceanihabitans sediminis]|uniref:class I SAM-dependent methyltransferase n=1 Tax=Oceanihabitans sediminis TaxID=1812012 RepID=UPI00299DB8F6|nr:class I SAM-dependent methyltransferase [Oceanihabitans sediminis]MDX1773001.1 class I SAM-dependent methyltransferase [Oceanihabitans sediminis]